jgi:hypothetical protein
VPALRRYSLVTGWDNYVISNDNIKSKTSTDNTCTNDGIWEIGLTTGATCLKLTIKDGGANDTDGAHPVFTGLFSLFALFIKQIGVFF